MSLSSPLTVVGLMNGMIGGVILVLPVTSYQAGYIYTILAITFSGAFSLYSCILSIKHLGDKKDMNESMEAHFGSKLAKIIYDIVVWLGLLFGSMFYFGLICIQWQSLTGKDLIAIPLSNAGLLFILIFVLKYFDFGASLMAYGIISVAAYLMFLIWVIATAPKGQNTWKPIGTNLYTFGATMSLAFAIQAFFIPVLMKNPVKEKHVLLTVIAYAIGALVYFYISFIGSFGIMNRIPLINNPQTIQGYFKVGNIQLKTIEVIYLIHLYSCLPEFTLISKKRLFNIFKVNETEKGKIPYKQIIYGAVFIGICLIIRLLKVRIDTIIAINGAIIGFFNIYLFPAILHIKCLYFSRNKREFLQQPSLQSTKKQFDLQFNIKNLSLLSDRVQQPNSIRNDILLIQRLSENSRDPNQKKINDSIASKDQNRAKIQPVDKIQQDQRELKPINQIEKIRQVENKTYFVCNCKCPQSLILKIIQLIIVFAMAGLGAAIMANGLISVI